MKKYLLILIASIGIDFYLSAQSAGDYRSIGSGNWNDPTKWQIFNGSSWVSNATYPGQNSGTGTVTIKILHELKLAATVPNPITSLLIEQLNDYTPEGVVVSQNGIVVFSSGNPVSLRVSGDVVIHGELKIDDLNGTKTHTLFVGAMLEVNTAIYDDCGNIIEMIPATFQTINQDDKLGVVFTGSTWINTGPNGITFQDVTLNCTNLGVSYPVHIKGTATFINGIVGISLRDDSYPCSIGVNFNGSIVFHDGATVSGASNASFVYGVVTKLGDDPFTFPIGDGNVYSPLTISAPANPATISANYGKSNALANETITDPGLFNVSNCESWFLYSEPSNNLDVTVSWSAASGCGSLPYITNVSEVTLAHFNYSDWVWDSHGGSGIGTTTNGSVTMSGVNINSNYSGFTLGNTGACNGPSPRSVTNISSTSATLNWSAAKGAVSYDVDYKLNNSVVWTNAATATTSTSVNISGLAPLMLYNWSVRTNCSSSSSGYAGGHFQTICNAPTGLSTTNITNSSATLNWLAVEQNASYAVFYKQSTSTTWIQVATNTPSLSFTLVGLTANSAYEWRVISLCNMLSGDAAQSFFTTLQGPPPPPPPLVCNDVYETNNTSSQAKTISLGNTISAAISSANDVDWFKVTTPNNSNTNLDVRLSNLIADYDLFVYNKSLKLVGSSVALGTSNEMVIYNSSARKATYYIRIIGKNGANNPGCYSLLAQALSGSNKTASQSSVQISEVAEDPSSQLLYPNPASEFVQLSFNSTVDGSAAVQIFNVAGQLIKQPVIKINKGFNQVKVAVNDIKQGMYLLKINKGELNMVRRFVIAR